LKVPGALHLAKCDPMSRERKLEPFKTKAKKNSTFHHGKLEKN